MAERHVTLVRHAKYVTDSRLMGGGDLTPDGVEQAGYLAQALYQQYPITALYSSTLRRAVSTAHIVATAGDGMSFRQDEDLCEALFHIPEKDAAYFAERFGDVSSDAVTVQRIRVAHAYNTYMIPAVGDADEHDVIVSHGNVIRYFTMRAIDAPMDLWTHIEVYHTGITRFVVMEDERVKLVTHNEVAHLPRRLWSVH